MATYQTTDSSGVFSYELTYSHNSDGWAIDRLSVAQDGKEVFAKDSMTGTYAAESLLLAHGIGWCETVVNHLREPQKDEH